MELHPSSCENLAVHDRICSICKQNVKAEVHVLIQIPAYQTLTDVLFDKANDKNDNFVNMKDPFTLKYWNYQIKF